MDGVNKDALEKVRLKTEETLGEILKVKVGIKAEDPRVLSIYNEVNGRGIENVPDDEMRRYVVQYF